MASRSSSRRSAKRDQPESVGSLARFFITLVILTWALRSFIVQPFNIPSGSMLPTLYIGDYLLVAKWPYGYSRYSFPFSFPSFAGRILMHVPKRGDVVVFKVPAEHADLIKRVIGVPGDTVALSDGRLILNGKLVPRSGLPAFEMPVSANSPCKVVPPAFPKTNVRSGRRYCIYPAYLESLPDGPSYTVLDQVNHGPADDFGPLRVPAGHVFLMGDNRDDSLDSRFPAYEGGVGMVPFEDLMGRALVTFWSTDGSVSYVKPWTWFTALRANRIGNGYSGEAK
ncbi:MAG TPA: signal peptidase I [Sphingomicrobium sp.]|jgi:signal peptidase I|nr:signal peptidase I [Sphingomicrobium sp.]